MTVVFVAAIFDLLHQGHLNLLQQMNAIGDKSIVILHDDRSCYEIKGKVPVQNLRQRVRNVKITGLADKVMVTRSIDPARAFERVIRRYRDKDLLYVRGNDLAAFPGRWMLERHGIPILFVPYTEGVSSTGLREKL